MNNELNKKIGSIIKEKRKENNYSLDDCLLYTSIKTSFSISCFNLVLKYLLSIPIAPILLVAVSSI